MSLRVDSKINYLYDTCREDVCELMVHETAGNKNAYKLQCKHVATFTFQIKVLK